MKTFRENSVSPSCGVIDAPDCLGLANVCPKFQSQSVPHCMSMVESSDPSLSATPA